MDRLGGIHLPQRDADFHHEPTCSTLTPGTLSLRSGTHSLCFCWEQHRQFPDPLAKRQLQQPAHLVRWNGLGAQRWPCPSSRVQNSAAAASKCPADRCRLFAAVGTAQLRNPLLPFSTMSGSAPRFVATMGILFKNANNSFELARALGELLSNPRKCSQFGENGYRSVLE